MRAKGPLRSDRVLVGFRAPQLQRDRRAEIPAPSDAHLDAIRLSLLFDLSHQRLAPHSPAWADSWHSLDVAARMRGAGDSFSDANGLCLALCEYVPKPFRLFIHRMLMPLKDCSTDDAHRTYRTHA